MATGSHAAVPSPTAKMPHLWRERGGLATGTRLSRLASVAGKRAGSGAVKQMEGVA